MEPKVGRHSMGRPTDAIKKKFQDVLEKSKAFERLTMILRKTENEAIFLKAYELVADRAWGKPQQQIDIDVNEQRKIVVVHEGDKVIDAEGKEIKPINLPFNGTNGNNGGNDNE